MLEQHSSYFGVISTISWYIAGMLAVLKFFELLFEAAQYGNFLGFVLVLITSSVITFLWGIYYFILIFLVIFVVSVIPYLVIRGIKK